MASQFTPSTTYLGDRRIATHTDLFREENSNSAALAASIAPAVMAERQASALFRVAEVGCSRGLDTLSMATAFLAHGVRAHITGIDINPHAISHAQSYAPLEMDREDLALKAAQWGLSGSCLNVFEEVDEYHLKPGPALQATTSFQEGDLRDQPLHGEYDAVVVNNVLTYYLNGPRSEFTSIIGNVASGLAPGGILTVSNASPHMKSRLGEAGFEPTPTWQDDPSRPVFFQQTTMMTDGVIPLSPAG